jgi:hypothetical protein
MNYSTIFADSVFVSMGDHKTKAKLKNHSNPKLPDKETFE